MEKEAYIYFLFEHKSYKDRMVIFQVLKYMIEIWEAKIKNDLEMKKKGIIFDTEDIEIPIVVYHNKDKWNIKRTLGEMIPNFMELPDNIKKYIPNFEYMLVDLAYPDENKEINLAEEHSIIIKILSRARYATKDEIIEIFTETITLLIKTKDNDIVRQYITESIIYIISVRDDLDKNELIEIAGKISEKGGDIVMTLAERLIEEGIEKGKKETLVENIITLLTIKFGTIPSDIKEKISKLDNKILNIILTEIFRYEYLDDIKKYLK